MITVNGKEISTNPVLAKGDVGLGNVTNDGKKVMLDVTSTGDRRAYVKIDSSERYGLSLGDGTMCYIDYVVNEIPEIENVIENIIENSLENTVD